MFWKVLYLGVELLFVNIKSTFLGFFIILPEKMSPGQTGDELLIGVMNCKVTFYLQYFKEK